MPPHPRRRQLEARLDRELAPAAAFRIRVHLLHCGACAAVDAALRDERRRTSSALAALGARRPAAEGWSRFAAATGQRALVISPSLRAAAVLALLAGAATLVPTPGHRRLTELNKVAHELATRPEKDVSRPAREGTADVRFVDLIAALRRAGQARVTREECCADHDAEGPPDDGLLALQLNDPATSVLVMYDDVDRSRNLSRGDLVRWVSLTPVARAALPVQLASRTR